MGITCRLYRGGRLEETDFDPARVSDLLAEPGALVWLDVEQPTERDMRLLGEEFGFHELALEDCLHPHQRPKAEPYDDHFFLVVYGASVRDGQLVQHEIAAFLSKRYLVTVRKDPAFAVEPVVARWEARADLAAEGGGYLLYILLDEVVDGYFAVLEKLEDAVEDLEERVVDPDAGHEAQAELFHRRKELVHFRRRVAPLREVLDAISRSGHGILTETLEPYYRDVYDHVLRATDFIDGQRDTLGAALEAYLSTVSNRLNLVMKGITSWGAIILVPTLIAGIYGMNFRHMPELEWRLGYPMALGIMAVAAFVLYRVFKRRDWL